MVVDHHNQAAAVCPKQTSTGDIQQLQQQLTALSEHSQFSTLLSRENPGNDAFV